MHCLPNLHFKLILIHGFQYFFSEYSLEKMSFLHIDIPTCIEPLIAGLTADTS